MPCRCRGRQRHYGPNDAERHREREDDTRCLSRGEQTGRLRGAAPKDIPAEAIKYYEDLFKKLSASKLWKEKYIQENMLTPDYTTSAETYKLWEAQNNMYAKIMKEMGIIK